MALSGASLEEITLRAQQVWDFMRHRQGEIEPLDALALIAWPSEEARRLFSSCRRQQPEGECSRCGCPDSQHTPGCQTCWDRQYRRARRARERGTCDLCDEPVRARGLCARHYWKRYYAEHREEEKQRKRRERGSKPLSTECRRCGCDLDDYTDGCRACWQRRYARRQRLLMATAES